MHLHLVFFLGDGGSFDLGFRGDFFVIIHLFRLTDLPLPSRIILRAASSLFFNPVNSTLFFLDGFFEYLSFAYSTSSFNLTNWLCGTIIVGKSLDDFLWLFSQCSQQMNPSCQFHPSVLKSFLYSRWISGFLGKLSHFNFDQKVLKHSEELQFQCGIMSSVQKILYFCSFIPIWLL